MSSRAVVLVVDDEEFVRDSLAEVLRAEGFACVLAADAREAKRVLGSQSVQVVVTDLRMPKGDGISLIEEARGQGIAVPILVLTGHGTVADAVAAMKAGAHDFLLKPVDPEQLVLHVRRALEHRALLSEVRFLRESVNARRPRGLIGSSVAMTRLRSLLAQVAPTEATVLITGESGTGKELAAEEVHRLSKRAAANLVRVNCAAIPETLFESEFFGHRRGAFSGATADRIGRFAEAEGGTLVLDEIGTLSVDMQAKLLRILESGEYQVVGESTTRVADVRVVAVTNEDLAARVKSGAFRADLFYRLHIFPVEVPALRAHKEDIPELAEHLLSSVWRSPRSPLGAAALGTLSKEALEVLASYDWPGNVRELRNVIERALIVSVPSMPDAALLRSLLESALPVATASSQGEFHLRSNLDAAEKQLLQRALARTEGKKKEAATLLGIDPRNLGYYLRKHKMEGGGAAGAPER